MAKSKQRTNEEAPETIEGLVHKLCSDPDCRATFTTAPSESTLDGLCHDCARVEAKAPRPKRRQVELPGLEKPRIAAIERAADEYREARHAQKLAADHAAATKDRLIAQMRRNGQTSYRDDTSDPPVVITLEARDSVKIVEVRPEPKTGLERAIERISKIGSPDPDGDAA